MKLQDPVTMIISAITQNICTTSTLIVVGCQRTGRRATEGLRRKEAQTFFTKGPPNTASGAELRIVAEGVAEAHTHRDLYTACTTTMKPTITPKIAPSTSTPNRKYVSLPP
jgi:hypothetical protein